MRGANWSLQLQNLLFFLGFGRNVWHWRSPQRRSKNGFLKLARPCCFPVSRPGFWEAFSVLSPGVAGCVSHTRVNAIPGASRGQCEVQIEAFSYKTSFFLGFGRNVWHRRSPQRRSKNGLLKLARPCCFPVSRPGFWEAFSVLSPGVAGCDSHTRVNAIPGASRGQCEVQIEAFSYKSSFFSRFWTQRLTLKIAPTQVQKRAPEARQAMLFPRFAARLLGSFFGAEPWCCCGCDSHTRINASQGASRSQCEVQIEAFSYKTFFFF